MSKDGTDEVNMHSEVNKNGTGEWTRIHREMKLSKNRCDED